MGCGSVKGEGGMLFGERFSWFWTMEEMSIFGRTFGVGTPIWGHHEACFRFVMLRSGLMMGDYYYFLFSKKQYIDQKIAPDSQRVH